ncbi:hypothetical protein VC273_22320 [Xanthomonas nasturtii]|nr:hypothetical protein [Xanthomonas arboricola]MEA9558520.1 hypothetical protein [Xanthomonas nasturtii]
MEAWTDSLLDIERAVRKPVHVWARKIIGQLRDVGRSDPNFHDAIAGASNNYALIVYLLGCQDQAQRACQRQIEFADRYLPASGLQPRINLIRLHRGRGNYELADRSIDELIQKATPTSALMNGQGASDSAFVERIYLHEKFLLELKMSGPIGLLPLLREIETDFPALKNSTAFAERLLMAGMLQMDESIVREALSSPSWKISSQAGLVRMLYASYWLACLGDAKQAIQLVRRMSALGGKAYQWKDHVILRILERLAGLARMVGEDHSAEQLHLIRGQVARGMGDISALVSATYQLRNSHPRYRHLWLSFAVRSGYGSLPGIPAFAPRKKTVAAGRVLLEMTDQAILASYKSYAAKEALRFECDEAALA